ncbi:MAG TPA: hypothetical protein VLC48_01300, partial [Gemmatimonadota bacterium]|nr:hypothetical protein [Gemmatimonadota bacterium]
MSGRTGRQTIGFLNVVTGRDEDLGAPVTNFAVARVKRDIGRSSYVGGIVTHRYEEGGVTNLAGGADWSLWLSQPLVFQGFFAATTDSREGGDDITWNVTLDYTGDWVGWLVQHTEIGPDLRPDMGFVRRLDIETTSGALRFTPRPPIPGLRKIDIRNSFEYVESEATGQVLDRAWELSLSPQLNTGDEAEIELRYQFQRLFD